MTIDQQLVNIANNINIEDLDESKKKKSKKPYSSKTITTGDPAYNIKMFNKHFGTDGLPNGGIAAQTVTQADTLGGVSGADASSAGSDAGASAGGEAGSCCEELELDEAKRYVRRYYMRPQNIPLSNKAEVLKALIDHADENCTIYSLNRLGGIKDFNKLTTDDVIYYYDDGILYDKNHVRIMDYDLAIKHEEEREKVNVEQTSDARLSDIYADRMTELTDLEEEVKNEFDLDFEPINEEAADNHCCICGEEIVGYGNNAEPYKSGRCCDACNLKFVIPARMEEIKGNEK